MRKFIRSFIIRLISTNHARRFQWTRPVILIVHIQRKVKSQSANHSNVKHKGFS